MDFPSPHPHGLTFDPLSFALIMVWEQTERSLLTFPNHKTANKSTSGEQTSPTISQTGKTFV